MRLKKQLNIGIILILLLGVLMPSRVVAQNKEDQKRQKSSQSFMLKAEKAKAEGNFAQSEADYRQAVAKNPKNAEATYNFGHLYNDNDKQKEGMQHLLQTAKNAKSKSLKHKAYHNLGNAFMTQKDYGQAVKAYKDALRNDPTDDKTRYNLAIAKKKQEKQQKENKNKKNKNKDKKNDKDNKDKNKDKDNKKKDQKDKDKNQNQNKNKDKDKDQNKNKQNQDQQQNKHKNDQEKKEQQQQQPQKGDISKQQAENLLKAAQNLEKKVQRKLKAKKAKKAPKNPNEKNW